MATVLNVWCVQCLYLCVNIDLNISKGLSECSQVMVKVARPPVCSENNSKVWNWRVAKSWTDLTLILVKKFAIRYNSILIFYNTIYLKQANCTYLLERFTTQRLTDANLTYKTLSKHTRMIFGVHFYHVSMGSTYHTYHTTLWPEFVAKGMVGWNFCTCCALLIHEVDKLSQYISKNTHKLNLLKRIQMWSSQVGSYLLRCTNYISTKLGYSWSPSNWRWRYDCTSFHSLHFLLVCNLSPLIYTFLALLVVHTLPCIHPFVLSV